MQRAHSASDATNVMYYLHINKFYRHFVFIYLQEYCKTKSLSIATGFLFCNKRILLNTHFLANILGNCILVNNDVHGLVTGKRL